MIASPSPAGGDSSPSGLVTSSKFSGGGHSIGVAKTRQRKYPDRTIAESTGEARQTVCDWISSFADLSKLGQSGKTQSQHADERFDPPGQPPEALLPTIHPNLQPPGTRCQPPEALPRAIPSDPRKRLALATQAWDGLPFDTNTRRRCPLRFRATREAPGTPGQPPEALPPAIPSNPPKRCPVRFRPNRGCTCYARTPTVNAPAIRTTTSGAACHPPKTARRLLVATYP